MLLSQELLIVASLGLIIMDILRSHLLFKDEGLPLGILASKQCFTELQYVVSSDFRLGLAGFTQKRKRAIFGLLIVSSTLISLFAGPSAALLLIPTVRSDWPAGGASAWLAGDENSLWPSLLTDSSWGGSQCSRPNVQALVANNLNDSACIWAGYSPIAEAFKQRHWNDRLDLIIDDGVLQRQLVVHPKGEVAETWAITSHMAIGLLSKNLGNAWYDALLGIEPSSPKYTLRYREHNKTTGSIQSWAPAVRVGCFPHLLSKKSGEEAINVSATCSRISFTLR